MSGRMMRLFWFPCSTLFSSCADPGVNEKLDGTSVSFRVILPNLITVLTLVIGLTSIMLSLHGYWKIAVWGVLVSGVLDACDGHIARLLNGTSKFGAELDNISDFVNFGVVPSILLYMWLLKEHWQAGWIVSLIFSVSCALRLARFSASQGFVKPKWQTSFLTGVPAPAGAITGLVPFYINEIAPFSMDETSAIISSVYIVFIASLMVSRIPTFAPNNVIKYLREQKVISFLIGLAFTILVMRYQFHVLLALAVCYLICVPFSWRSFLRLAARENQ